MPGMQPGVSKLHIRVVLCGVCAGEVVVFNINGRDIPIVHRVIKVHERTDENHLDILTKVG
jgi:signal peptidase